MEYIVSRRYKLPSTAQAFESIVHYNLWPKKFWPYKELRIGDILYWYETRNQHIVWKTRTVKVERFTYQSKDDLRRIFELHFGDFDENERYAVDAPERGYCLAYKSQPLQRLNVPKPNHLRFPQLGWLSTTDKPVQGWLSRIGVEKMAFGAIPGYPPGSHFASRRELFDAGIHRQLQAGIVGSETKGAESIVLSGGYEDDEDHGNLIIYTGEGGRDPQTGKQIADQVLTRGNRALALNQLRGFPLRVIRGADHYSPWSPDTGYRYDGLYRVEDHWHTQGKAGFRVWRYRLMRWEEEELGIVAPTDQGTPDSIPRRGISTVLRIIRDTYYAKMVKRLYDYQCQICGIRLQGAVGPYAEAAHIQPLGRPHNGPDTLANLLCLCPNHHVLFDYRAFSIADDLSLIGLDGSLMIHPKHTIGRTYLQYRREHY